MRVSLVKFGAPPKLIKLIMSLHERFKMKFCIDGIIHTIESIIGVKQGDILGPVLFLSSRLLQLWCRRGKSLSDLLVNFALSKTLPWLVEVTVLTEKNSHSQILSMLTILLCCLSLVVVRKLVYHSSWIILLYGGWKFIQVILGMNRSLKQKYRSVVSLHSYTKIQIHMIIQILPTLNSEKGGLYQLLPASTILEMCVHETVPMH